MRQKNKNEKTFFSLFNSGIEMPAYIHPPLRGQSAPQSRRDDLSECRRAIHGPHLVYPQTSVTS